MWRRYCCLTSFFPIVDTCLSCEDIARQSCELVRRWRLFGDFLRAVFSASRAQHVSDLHSKFTLECGPMPNVIDALPNIGGALCSTLQRLADSQYWSGVQ